MIDRHDDVRSEPRPDVLNQRCHLRRRGDIAHRATCRFHMNHALTNQITPRGKINIKENHAANMSLGAHIQIALQF